MYCFVRKMMVRWKSNADYGREENKESMYCFVRKAKQFAKSRLMPINEVRGNFRKKKWPKVAINGKSCIFLSS